MKSLSIDPGSRKFGWAIQEDTTKIIACGTVHLDVKRDVSFRLAEVQQRVQLLIDRYQPEEVALEEAFMGKNASSYGKLMMARGVIISVAISNGLSLHEYSPKTVKVQSTGTSGASKEVIIASMMLQYNVKRLLQEDEADAIAIGLTHKLMTTGLHKSISDASLAICKPTMDMGKNTRHRASSKSKSKARSRNAWTEALQGVQIA